MKARSVEAIMDCFAAHSYGGSNHPCWNSRDSLLAGSGALLPNGAFPADGTRQPTHDQACGKQRRLPGWQPRGWRMPTRPLRLAYAGQCLRVRGSHLQRSATRPGSSWWPCTRRGRRRVVLTAVEALAAVGLTAARAAPCAAFGRPASQPAQPALARALDREGAGLRSLRQPCWGLCTAWVRPVPRTRHTRFAGHRPA